MSITEQCFVCFIYWSFHTVYCTVEWNIADSRKLSSTIVQTVQLIEFVSYSVSPVSTHPKCNLKLTHSFINNFKLFYAWNVSSSNQKCLAWWNFEYW
jgi:hypothetical protein